MTKRLTYTKAHLLSSLHDELIAAGIAPTYLGDKPGTANGIEMDVADEQDEAAVAAVVAAHNRASAQAAWDAARQAEADDDTQARGLVAQLDDAITLASGAGTLTAAQMKAGLLLALRSIRLVVKYELRRRGAG
jgi:hypothetical protein